MLDMHQRTVSTIVGRSAVDTPTGLFLDESTSQLIFTQDFAVRAVSLPVVHAPVPASIALHPSHQQNFAAPGPLQQRPAPVAETAPPAPSGQAYVHVASPIAHDVLVGAGIPPVPLAPNTEAQGASSTPPCATAAEPDERAAAAPEEAAPAFDQTARGEIDQDDAAAPAAELPAAAAEAAAAAPAPEAAESEPPEPQAAADSSKELIPEFAAVLTACEGMLQDNGAAEGGIGDGRMAHPAPVLPAVAATT